MLKMYSNTTRVTILEEGREETTCTRCQQCIHNTIPQVTDQLAGGLVNLVEPGEARLVLGPGVGF